jgi:hypothetical protein
MKERQEEEAEEGQERASNRRASPISYSDSTVLLGLTFLCLGASPCSFHVTCSMCSSYVRCGHMTTHSATFFFFLFRSVAIFDHAFHALCC